MANSDCTFISLDAHHILGMDVDFGVISEQQVAELDSVLEDGQDEGSVNDVNLEFGDFEEVECEQTVDVGESMDEAENESFIEGQTESDESKWSFER